MSLTLILIIVTVIASFYAWSNESILSKWMLNPYAVNKHKEYYRFITSGLIHNDYVHLFFNMWALYSFGQYLEFIFTRQFGDSGKLLYGLLYILGVVASDIPTYLKHRNQPHYNSLGASGGVSSIVFAFILINPLAELSLMFIPIGIPGFIFGALYMFYSYYQARRGGDYINHDAHLYGALFGIVFTIIVMPAVLPNFFEILRNGQWFNL